RGGAVVAAVEADAIHRARAEQRDTEDALDRRQHHRQVVVEGDEAIRADEDAIAGEELVVGAGIAALGDGAPIDGQDLSAAVAARCGPRHPDALLRRYRRQTLNRADG